MTRSTFMRLILIISSGLILLGIILTSVLLATRDERNVVRVNLDRDQEKRLTFDGLALVPGESCSYDVLLTGQSVEHCDVLLKFSQAMKDQTLQKYAFARIEINGQLVCDELLETLMAKEEGITVPPALIDRKNNEMKITYYLPIEVGNEAKNAVADFDLLITATNE